MYSKIFTENSKITNGAFQVPSILNCPMLILKLRVFVFLHLLNLNNLKLRRALIQLITLTRAEQSQQ